MEFKGLGQNGAQVRPRRIAPFAPALVRRGAPRRPGRPLLLLAALFARAGIAPRRSASARWTLRRGPRPGGSVRTRTCWPGYRRSPPAPAPRPRDGDAQRRGRREAAVLGADAGYWNSWLARRSRRQTRRAGDGEQESGNDGFLHGDLSGNKAQAAPDHGRVSRCARQDATQCRADVSRRFSWFLWLLPALFLDSFVAASIASFPTRRRFVAAPARSLHAPKADQVPRARDGRSACQCRRAHPKRRPAGRSPAWQALRGVRILAGRHGVDVGRRQRQGQAAAGLARDEAHHASWHRPRRSGGTGRTDSRLGHADSAPRPAR